MTPDKEKSIEAIPMKTIEEIRAAIETSEESDATYTDSSTLAELKASQTDLPKKFKPEPKPLKQLGETSP